MSRYAAKKKYNMANREKINEIARRSYYKHRDEILEKRRVEYKKSPEVKRKYSREYHAAHRKKINQQHVAWASRNREKVNRNARIRYHEKKKEQKNCMQKDSG